MDQAVLLSLKCPSCGAPLKIKSTIDTFACAYCASTIQVDRSHGAITLNLLKDALQGVQRGTDRTAAELAIRRLTDELVQLEAERARHAGDKQRIEAQWANQIQLAKTRSNGLALLIVGVAMFLFAIALGNSILDFATAHPSDRAKSVVVISALAIAGAMAWWVRSKIGRGQELEVDRLEGRLEHALVEPSAALSDVEKRIGQTKRSLATQRSIVA